MRGSTALLALTLSTVALTSAGHAQTTRNAMLQWQSPTERENGTPLAITDLAEFRVYNLTTAGPAQMGKTAGTVNTITLPIAAKTCYRFVVTAVDKDGNESAYSNEAQLCTFGPKPPKSLAVELMR